MPLLATCHVLNQLHAQDRYPHTLPHCPCKYVDVDWVGRFGSSHVRRTRRPEGIDGLLCHVQLVHEQIASSGSDSDDILTWQVVSSEAKPNYVTLEMYAAVPSGGDVSTPGNMDLFDASGLAKFLATEIVVETGKDPLRTTRDKGIDTIVKYQIRVRNNKTSSDVNVQAEFARFARFEDGAILPAEDAAMFAKSTGHSSAMQCA